MEPHGLKGDLYILIFSQDVSWADDLVNFRLVNEQTGATQILTVEGIKSFKKGVIVKPKEFTNRNQSEAVAKFLFEIPEELLVSGEGETIYLAEILGFKIFDHNKLVGEIKSFSSNSMQDLLIVHDAENFVIEIPFVDELVEDIDYDKKEVYMNLPEGLLDINRAAKE